MGSVPNPVQIKVCGLTSSEQAEICVGLGAEMIGLNCWKPSPRFVSPRILRDIVEVLEGKAEIVAVFVNEAVDTVNRTVKELQLDAAQLHGDETPDYTGKLEVPWFKAFRVSDSFSSAIISTYARPRFLLDAYSKSSYGGTGQTIDWEIAKEAKSYGNLILSGGLTPENVAEAVRRVRPYAVDVCSGVESEPGLKDLHAVERFIQVVRSTVAQLSHPPNGDPPPKEWILKPIARR